jgi:hypothetical protein
VYIQWKDQVPAALVELLDTKEAKLTITDEYTKGWTHRNAEQILTFVRSIEDSFDHEYKQRVDYLILPDYYENWRKQYPVWDWRAPKLPVDFCLSIQEFPL